MTHRFFDNIDAFANAVLAGEPIDTGCGATDGDHPSWLMSALDAPAGEALCLVKLMTLFHCLITVRLDSRGTPFV